KLKPAGSFISDEINSGSAKKMGIPSKISVVVGGADTQCALLGTKTMKTGQTCAVAGTSTPVQIVVSTPSIDKQYRIWTGCHVVPNMWVIDSDAGETGHNLRWFKKIFNLDYPEIDRLAEQAQPGSSGFIANLGGSIANYGNLSEIGYGGFLIPLPIISTEVYRAQICRGILENLAYVIKANVHQVEELSGLKVGTENFALAGGQAKSKIFTDILCNVLGIPINIYKVKEASGLGCAILAAVGIGIYKNFDEATENMVHLEQIIEPNKNKTKKYKKLFKKWRKIYNQFLKIK
ncbi:MAG: FGGY-family carbohydrate kinase, partial [Candidatus Helarchaeota archaeon]